MPRCQPTPSCERLFRTTLALFLLMQFPVPPSNANAQDKSTQPDASQLSAMLDSRRFVGTLKAIGDSTPEEDGFAFKDGKFVSEGCLKWGFSPAPYWVRPDKDGLHFLSELSSPEHGTMRYEGVFDGTQIKGTAYWKKQRWYWTLEREYSFQGKPPVSGQ